MIKNISESGWARLFERLLNNTEPSGPQECDGLISRNALATKTEEIDNLVEPF